MMGGLGNGRNVNMEDTQSRRIAKVKNWITAFGSGMGGALNMFGSRPPARIGWVGETKTDAERLASDWERVGIRWATKHAEREETGGFL